mmetsp:Transcript_21267/g.59128  ORF Transcript_21267/g.59128 Transcript_21267/m.59128 type:complete len:249 (+) Transcript_21267:71-817(+)
MATPVSSRTSFAVNSNLSSVRRQASTSCASRASLAALQPRRFRMQHGRAQVTVEARRASDPIVPPAIMGRGQEGGTDLMTHLLRNRIIFIGTRITDQVCTEVVAKLLALEASNPKAEIKIYLNSQGGTGHAIVGILDAMRNCKCPISTVAFGLVASNATILLASGTKGRRFSMPNTRILLCQPYGGAMGSAEEVNIQASELNRTMKVTVRFLQEATGLDEDTIEQEIDRENFLSAEESIKMGLIDAIL